MLKSIRTLLKILCGYFSNGNASPSNNSNYVNMVEQNRKLQAHIDNLEKLLPELRHSEERYRLLLDICTEYAYSLKVETDEKVELEWATDSISRIINTPPAKYHKHDDIIPAIIHPRDKNIAHHRLQQLLAGQIDVSEFKIVDNDKQTRWFRDISYPILDHNHRKVETIYGVAQDITEHKLHEEQLTKEHNLLRTLIDHLPDDIYVKDNQGRFILINEPLRRRLGASSPQEVIGKTDFDFAYPHLAQQAYQDEQTLLQSGESLISHMEPFIDPLTGNQKRILITKIPIRGSDGQVAGLVGMNRDVTHLKMAEEALQQGKDFAEGIIDTAQVIILVLNKTGHIIRFNHYLEEISGYKLNEVKGKNWVTTFVPSEERKQARWRFSQAINNVQTKGKVNSIITKSGNMRAIEWYDKTLKDSNNKIIGLLAIGQDITERIRFEKERDQLFDAVNKQREQLQALTRQLANTQEVERKALTQELHDQVGQNLTALDLNLNIIQAQLFDDSKTSLDTIQQRIQDSLDIISQTGDRIRDVMANLRPQILDDYGLIAALRWYCRIFASRVNFTVNIDAEELSPRLSPPVEDSLFRIVQEALTNVAKHAQPNLATVSINSYNGMVYLIVNDDGKGFETVSQTDPAKKQHWGLITMTERAAAVGGYCRIESQPNNGTRVIVEVPHRDNDRIS
ncbi:MAG: PAS domain S-box protein [Anaerolineae bacterium]|nr:PAS domain S-box protein [Anaerolineae bacterium]